MTSTPTENPSVLLWIKERRGLPAAIVMWIYEWFTANRKASYGLAVMRMASGALILGWLLVNAPVTSKIWGPGSAYLEPYRSVLGYQWPLDVLRDAGMGLFVTWYVVAILLALAFMIGWKTRFVTPLLFIFYTAINAQNTPISDGGNYFIRIMLIYLIFADLSKRWSLDAWLRNRKEKKKREHEFATILHNLSLCLVVAQLCIVYFEAGMYKVQGALWQEGTAMYYPISSEAYGIFPWLSSLITWNSWVVVIITYLTVIIQIAFPFMLFHRISRRIALVLVLGMHIGIAVVMGLPFFSGIMASADAVLVSSATWLTVYAWLAGCWRKVFGRRRDEQNSASVEETEPDRPETTKIPVSV
ncbi:HTTM domain-containing protein [Glutamicibacter protophormiae]|uniref:HTTM domain-containing protein n=1 Tax=Glutamicibacter protophormiae TaxID=37930 RepID=UPI002A81FCC3|nr:HTTM domain-containing protein [Glutamicibacter protophormiae]WPR63976.1 HTTM domain-containing protein [Glutamicibacter protophormiae]WPR67471.1 HTTM domain-containing protein [Glutamicibacter protophormiae]